MLIGARVLQGLGSGALFALSQTAIADFVSGPARGRYQGYFSGVFASSALAAPLLGGYLTEHLGWRSIFLVNLPLAAFAIFMVRRVLPAAAESRRDARIDWLGAALLAAVVVKLFLVDLARVGSLERIISFIVVGALILVIGWLSPLPPDRRDAEPAASPDARAPSDGTHGSASTGDQA